MIKGENVWNWSSSIHGLCSNKLHHLKQNNRGPLEGWEVSKDNAASTKSTWIHRLFTPNWKQFVSTHCKHAFRLLHRNLKLFTKSLQGIIIHHSDFNVKRFNARITSCCKRKIFFFFMINEKYLQGKKSTSNVSYFIFSFISKFSATMLRSLTLSFSHFSSTEYILYAHEFFLKTGLSR